MEDKDNINDHVERMKMLLRSLDITATDLSHELGYKSHHSVFHILYGRNKIDSPKFIGRVIAKYPDVNRDFLAFGELPVLNSEKEKKELKPEFEDRLIAIESKIDKIYKLLKKMQ